MDSIKIKNFIIIVLLIVNAVLLSVFVSDSVREKSRSSGTVDGVVELLAENGIDVEYMYALAQSATDNAVMIFRFDKVDAAIDILQRHNFSILPPQRLCDL